MAMEDVQNKQNKISKNESTDVPKSRVESRLFKESKSENGFLIFFF